MTGSSLESRQVVPAGEGLERLVAALNALPEIPPDEITSCPADDGTEAALSALTGDDRP